MMTTTVTSVRAVTAPMPCDWCALSATLELLETRNGLETVDRACTGHAVDWHTARGLELASPTDSHSWADAFGNWHVRILLVPGHGLEGLAPAELEHVARLRIGDQLRMRESDASGWYCANVPLVVVERTPTAVEYREAPCERVTS